MTEFTGQELALGSISISILLSILLRMIYGTFPTIQNRFKPWIAVGLGVALAIVALITSSSELTSRLYVTYMVQGFMIGATAVGFYEVSQRKNDNSK